MPLPPSQRRRSWVQLNEVYHRPADHLSTNPDARIEQVNGQDRLALTGLDKLDKPSSLIALRSQSAPLPIYWCDTRNKYQVRINTSILPVMASPSEADIGLTRMLAEGPRLLQWIKDYLTSIISHDSSYRCDAKLPWPVGSGRIEV
jgi:hypothetical protein